jgi:hypothetical protein
MKFFDYKFILLVSLTMIVYFMYREIEHLNKRVLNLENNSNKVSVPLVKPLPQVNSLPLPPVKQNTITIDPNNLNIKIGTVEEYSNEIYSNDMGNNQPTSVESIIDMTNPVKPPMSINENGDAEPNAHFLSSHCSTSTLSEGVENDINLDNTESESIILDNNNSTSSSSVSDQPEQSQPEQSQPEQSQPEQSQPEQSQPEQSQPENKTSKEDLLKKKLGELQELATKNNISLTVDGSTKKKTKMQLINEMI